MKKLLILCLAIWAGTSCVSTKKFNSMRAEALRYESELEASRMRNDELSSNNDRLKVLNDDLAQQINNLRAHNDAQAAQVTDLETRYKQLLSDGSAEAARMLRQLEQNQREVEELQQLLRAREEAIDAIRRQVADALLGFEGKGLSITTRDGKVYVSMEDKLLFKSGSFDIDPSGAQAVRDLSVVLAQNPDISIMVEGHTDDVPYRPNGNLHDNLDLSVKRATTVTRLLLENQGIAPERIVAAGRGEYLPVDAAKTTEARAKNRRTEIILSPKLDELMKLMDR